MSVQGWLLAIGLVAASLVAVWFVRFSYVLTD
jgi:hypothetical protein